MKSIVRYFVQGLIVLVPATITIFVLYKLFDWFRDLFSKMQVIVNPYVDPFIVLVVILLLILIVGLFTSNVIAKFFLEESGKIIERIPFIKHIYSPVKDFTTAFIGNNKRFNHPVLVTTNREAEIREIGFITDEDLHELGLAKEFVAVYIPMSYSISGRLLIVPRENVKDLNIPAAEAMKFIVSGGVSEVDEHKEQGGWRKEERSLNQ
ncbi:MAG TPA: DUF502 domain-containing protein [Bacteroidia bacterium]|jgi:uncharacterized membrane protein|nr:DUF502 domain-containing protein [Bacteroidia bacterium]